MIIPGSIQFNSKHVDTEKLETVLLLEESKGLKKSATFIKVFNLGLKKYLENMEANNGINNQ